MKDLIFDPFPVLYTARLNLRALNIDDAESMHQLRSSREVMKLLDRPMTQTVEEAAELIETVFESQKQGTAIMWAMTLKNDPTMIGCICFVRTEAEHNRTEVGYLLNPQFHRQGLMSEALARVIEYGFDELEFHKIMASTNSLNEASIGLLEKHGFTREAFYRQHFFWNGRFIDTVEMARYSPAAERTIKERMTDPIRDVHA
jgi:ribosomal-protein-alanine N-acetyltransferase